MKKKKSVDERLKELEDFHYRVKLGQKWFLCGLALFGSFIAIISNFISTLHNWIDFHK